MRIPAYVTCVLAFVILCTACTPDKAAHHSPALQQILEDTLAAYNGPGAVMAVRFDDGTTWVGAAGTAQIGTSQPLTPAHRFRIGSVTKTFTAGAVLQLAGNGTLSLDDTVDDWLPGMLPRGDTITIRMLLNHSAGLFDYSWDEWFLDCYTDNLTQTWAPESLIGIATAYDPVAEPGATGIYSNTHYVVLGSIIEAASGLTVEKFITDAILAPLGLVHTSFPTTADISDPFARGYLDLNGDGLFSADEDVTDQHPGAFWTAGAILSTPEDLLLWLDELFSGTLLDDSLQAERLTFDVPMSGGGPDDFFGLGIATMGGSVGHTGALPGYQTMLFRYRNTDFAVYCNGYLTANDSVNIAAEIYQAARQVLFPELSI
jgi:D-alanyl-D-alanine carboxypeptidase